MTPTIFGLVNPQGVIENAFYWHEGDEYPCEDGYSIVRIDNVANCGIGWTYIDGVFAEPVLSEPETQPTVDGAEIL